MQNIASPGGLKIRVYAIYIFVSSAILLNCLLARHVGLCVTNFIEQLAAFVGRRRPLISSAVRTLDKNACRARVGGGGGGGGRGSAS